MDFQVIAPDGTKLTFASKTRTYSHAVIYRMTNAYAEETGRLPGWLLSARIGRPGLVRSAIEEAHRKLNCSARWDKILRKWVYTPEETPKFDVVVVEVNVCQ